MRCVTVFGTVLALIGLSGCAARTVPAGHDVEPFVGRSVTIEGVVDRTVATMPNGPQGAFCLTVPPGRWVTPVRETTLQHGQAQIAFESPGDAAKPSIGQRVRVTGRLQRLPAHVRDEPALPQYELRDAKWEAIASSD